MSKILQNFYTPTFESVHETKDKSKCHLLKPEENNKTIALERPLLSLSLFCSYRFEWQCFVFSQMT